MMIRNYVLCIGLLAGACCNAGVTVSDKLAYTGQTYEQLSRRPTDTVEAENVRIWFPLERQSQCRTTVEVLDSAGRVVRNLFSDMLPFGYYNFYWDKRDDSGRYVPEGEYVSRVTDDCGGVREAGLRVAYRSWETACLYYPPAGDSLPVIGFELTRDSVPVTLDMLRGPTNRVVILEDSLMNRGRYVFDMRADSTIGSGQYLVRLRTGEYVRAVSIRYRQ